MFDVNMGWLLLAYAAGTGFGIWIQFRNVMNATGKTIDILVANGYLRHRKNADGEQEILKLDEE